MHPLMNWLINDLAINSRQRTVSEIDEGIMASPADVFPDLVVVLQSWPDQFSANEVNRLLAYSPLSRVVVCYGTWCESDGRNRNIWPLSVRVPVWSAKLRIEHEWQLILNPGERPLLPLSASREEVFVAELRPHVPMSKQPSILVESPDSAYRQFLEELFADAGHAIVQNDPDMVLFDVDPWGPTRTEALVALRERFPKAVIHGLQSLMQPLMTSELRVFGIRTVSPKLGMLPELMEVEPVLYFARSELRPWTDPVIVGNCRNGDVTASDTEADSQAKHQSGPQAE